jgi:ABC-type cobalamin transport system permease subunit
MSIASFAQKIAILCKYAIIAFGIIISCAIGAFVSLVAVIVFSGNLSAVMFFVAAVAGAGIALILLIGATQLDRKIGRHNSRHNQTET